MRIVLRVGFSTLLLYGIWLALSGHYTGLLLTLGFLSALGCSLIAERMGILDSEGLPLGILVRLPAITFWLIAEILKSNLSVISVILDPSRATPTLVNVKTTQKTAVGLVTHANFITLTPGTVATAVNEKRRTISVHGLTYDLAQGCLDGGMDAKVTWLEGNSKS